MLTETEQTEQPLIKCLIFVTGGSDHFVQQVLGFLWLQSLLVDPKIQKYQLHLSDPSSHKY